MYTWVLVEVIWLNLDESGHDLGCKYYQLLHDTVNIICADLFTGLSESADPWNLCSSIWGFLLLVDGLQLATNMFGNVQSKSVFTLSLILLPYHYKDWPVQAALIKPLSWQFGLWTDMYLNSCRNVFFFFIIIYSGWAHSTCRSGYDIHVFAYLMKGLKQAFQLIGWLVGCQLNTGRIIVIDDHMGVLIISNRSIWTIGIKSTVNRWINYQGTRGEFSSNSMLIMKYYNLNMIAMVSSV